MKFDSQKVAFRVDAANEIGYGHVMRCFNFAVALKKYKVHSYFICREHPGNLISFLRENGFEVFVLPYSKNYQVERLNYKSWCGEEISKDAFQTLQHLKKLPINWLVIDHYGIDFEWEQYLKNHVKKILSIDDLANRSHFCDILVDQNYFIKMKSRYKKLLEQNTIQLLGPVYAILNQDFLLMRKISLARRPISKIDNILIFLSGSDPHQYTKLILDAIISSQLEFKRIDVVIGSSYSRIIDLYELRKKNTKINVHVQTKIMPMLMAQADFAITGGGTITWEKCVLGIPSLTIILSENQNEIAFEMERQGVHVVLDGRNKISQSLIKRFLKTIEIPKLNKMSEKAKTFCDGRGIERIIKKMELNYESI